MTCDIGCRKQTTVNASKQDASTLTLTLGRAQVCELPSVLAYPLFYKLITPGETTVSHGAARAWLAQRQITQARRAPPALGPRLAAVAGGRARSLPAA